jgi:hypothetical protein
MNQPLPETTPKNKALKHTIPLLNKKQLLIMLWISLLVLAAAILGAYVLGRNIYGGLTDNDRVIAVNGRADRHIDAISASIQIEISSSGSKVEDVKKTIENVSDDVYSYIEKEILTGEGNKIDVTKGNVELSDKKTDYEKKYIDGKEIEIKIDRYSAETKVTLSNVNVSDAKNIKTKIDFDFISNGNSTYTSVDLKYEYPTVNDLKPELLKESLGNARMAAEQFAKDSGQKIGVIKTANQGVVWLEAHDEYEIASIISVVTFYLK